MRNEAISGSSSLLSGGSSTVPQCLSEEYEDHLRRSHEDFQPLPRIFTKTIFTNEEPGALYRHDQLKANQNLIRMDKSDAWRSVAQDIKLSAAKEAVKTIYQAARATRRVFGRNNYNITLESAVDLERQLELSRERQANLVPAELVYMFPDMVLSIDDFHNHVEVAIQTHRYDTWQRGESNLLVIMAMIDRLSNTSYMGFQYSVDNVVDHLTTTGITTIPGKRRSVEELKGIRWNLKPSEQTMSWERWSVLGEPSGKWDYYVRYDAPINITLIEEIAATGWGDEFSNSEATPGKITILDEKDNWDDDERNGGRILVLQEQFSQNQQDFLDEYLP
ncbi:hypothetical protein Tco_0877782 [Tanacetum coccineum]|uniref:Uncharacterized protein n=1 Tax=Tanacetum coccineum TaxID=301880 RepID=A0ABQ5BWF2_9ASTR